MPLDLSHLVIAILAGVAGAVWMRRRDRPQPADPGPILSSRRAPPDRPAVATGQEPESLGLVERVLGALFIAGWLIAWSFGIAMVAGTLSVGESGAGGFLTGWLIAAVAAWFFAVRSLVQTIKGRRPKL